MLKQLLQNENITVLGTMIKNVDKIPETLKLMQEYLNTHAKALNHPDTELEKRLIVNMSALGLDVK